MYYLLTLITGICISLMIFFNGGLEGRIGNIPAILIIHTVAILLTSFMFIKKSPEKQREKKSRWYLLAGLIGIAVVTISNTIFSKGGVLLTLSGTLAGQVIMAAIIEFRKKFSIGKLVSLILVIPGASYLGFKSNLSIFWILLSWTPGILILLQSFMNSQNIISVGFRKTLVFHYGTALVGIIPLFFIFSGFQSITPVIRGEIPIQYIIGGGAFSLFVISIGSYLLLKVSPIKYVLIMYCGQLIGAISLDYIIGLEFSRDKLFSMILIVAGLIVGELKLRRKSGNKGTEKE